MRLGLDIGTNSIGWWLYATDGERITQAIDGGVRIFSDGRDPKSGASLAVDRRAARSMRRRRDRYLRRRKALMRKLRKAGLMPADPNEAKTLEKKLDPYELRARGLDEALPLTHLGRALFHLNQRRGFKSNRKAERGRGDNEGGKIKDATKRLDEAMRIANARTYGEFLHKRRGDKPEKPGDAQKTNKDGTRLDDRHTKSVRTRLTVARRDNAEKEEAGYDFYPDRRNLEEEFKELWAAQVKHHRDVLTDDLKNALFETIFHQRPLKEPKIGLCLFSGRQGVPSDERRLPKAHPLNQRRVLYETVNNLRVTADGRAKRTLTLDERDRIVHALDNRKPTKSPKSMVLKFDALGKAIKLASDERFTLQTVARDAIACDPVRASLSHPDRFGRNWSKLDLDAQWEAIRRIREVQSDADHTELVAWLKKTHGLDEAHAQATADAPLPEGYGRLGETASRKILGKLKSDVVTYSDAVEACGWHHSDHRTGEVLEQLPYYGEILERHVIPGSGNPEDDDITRFGRITNPTVHIGLNQLRRLVNKIVEVHGKPDQIVVELARELKQSKDQREDAQKRIKENTEAARKRSEKLAELRELNKSKEPADTGANRMLLRLWEDLNPKDCLRRRCPYTGKPIGAAMVFDGSCDVDHILPYSRTLDDSVANRTLCLREANREKGNKTPWEAWGGTPKWENIAANLKHLPKNKHWRFTPDAMERFEGENDFIDRALVDTQYLSRIARTYLDALYTEGGHVWVVPGRLTEMLRRHWGLNSLLPDSNQDRDKSTAKAKNRTDHRHHAIDAAVIAATDRGLIKKIADAAKRDEGNGLSAEDVARTTPEPWGFRTDIHTQLDKIVVSHRADRGRIDPTAKKQGRDSTAGQLHNDTAYGIVNEREVVSRTPLLSLKAGDIAVTTKGKNIRDPYLQKLLSEAIAGKEAPKEIEAALAGFAESERLPNGKYNPYRGIRHVRLIESLQSSARVEIKDATGKPYKAYKGDSNHCYEIWRMPDGKYQAWVVPNFYAHKADMPMDVRPATPATCLRPHPAAILKLRLQKNDMVRLENSSGKEIVATVEKFDVSGTIELIPHTEANAADRYNKDKSDNVYIRKRATPLMEAKARRVFVDEMGRLQDPGPPPPI